MLADIRGVVLNAGAASGVYEFEEVSRVRWTSSTLVISGLPHHLAPIHTLTTVPASRQPGIIPGAGDESRSTGTVTITFPLEEVSHVLVRELDGRETWRNSLVVGFVAGAVGGVIYWYHWLSDAFR